MGLLANARKHDYAVVASLLSAAAREGLADGPLWTQAGELLQRVAESANLTPGN
jgi:hypothetical protein